VSGELPILLHLPEPIGWIALLPDVLRNAQEAAREALGTKGRAMPAAGGAEPRLLSAEDAAAAFGVDPSWLLRQAREGRLPCIRLGKYVRFDRETIVGLCTRRAAV
jgi:hypothetical protein